MLSVGVRELRQRTSELLRRVEKGETIAVTDRGRQVAILAPPPDGSPLERLRMTGQVEPARGHIDELPPPLPATDGESLSEALERLRRDER